MRGSLASSPVERKNQAIYLIRIAQLEPDTTDLFLALNLIPLMDTAMTLSGPLELSIVKAKQIVVRLEGQELRLEPLPKPDRT